MYLFPCNKVFFPCNRVFFLFNTRYFLVNTSCFLCNAKSLKAFAKGHIFRKTAPEVKHVVMQRIYDVLQLPDETLQLKNDILTAGELVGPTFGVYVISAPQLLTLPLLFLHASRPKLLSEPNRNGQRDKDRVGVVVFFL